MHVAGKHQCRALAESMHSPSESLKEINHQLSTGITQELIHYCNSLGQGVCDGLCVHVSMSHTGRLLSAFLSLRW